MRGLIGGTPVCSPESTSLGIAEGQKKIDEHPANLFGRLPRWTLFQSLELCTSLVRAGG